MRLGAVLAPFSPAQQERPLADRARRYEDAGFTSLWAASSIGRGVFMVDPFVALSVAATVTRNVELGTGIIQVPLHHPGGIGASRAFTGRGVRRPADCGGGGPVHPSPTSRRWGGTTPKGSIRCIAIWRRCAAYFALGSGARSRSIRFRGPSPPIFYGTWGGEIERAAREFDGWIASARFQQAERLKTRLKRYRAAGGRRAVVTTIIVDPDSDLGKLRARLQQYADYGFDDAVIMFMPGAPDPERVRALA